MVKACIDTNVWISGILFPGKPAEIISAAFNRKFEVILSQVILDEIERNLLKKFNFTSGNTKRFINRIIQIADLYEPSGWVKVISNDHNDNLVLETAVIGNAKYLVTGDREHLLPLKSFKHVKIIDPAVFLVKLKN